MSKPNGNACCRKPVLVISKLLMLSIPPHSVLLLNPAAQQAARCLDHHLSLHRQYSLSARMVHFTAHQQTTASLLGHLSTHTLSQRLVQLAYMVLHILQIHFQPLQIYLRAMLSTRTYHAISSSGLGYFTNLLYYNTCANVRKIRFQSYTYGWTHTYLSALYITFLTNEILENTNVE